MSRIGKLPITVPAGVDVTVPLRPVTESESVAVLVPPPQTFATPPPPQV